MRDEQPSVRGLQSEYWARKLQPEIIKLFLCRPYVVLVAARLPLLRHKCRQHHRSWQNPITMDMAFAFFFSLGCGFGALVFLRVSSYQLSLLWQSGCRRALEKIAVLLRLNSAATVGNRLVDC